VKGCEYLKVAWQGFTVVESQKAGIRGYPFSEHTSYDDAPERCAEAVRIQYIHNK